MKQAYTCQSCFEPCWTSGGCFTECSYCGELAHLNSSCDKEMFGFFKALTCESFNEICKNRSLNATCDVYAFYRAYELDCPIDHSHSICQECIKSHPTVTEKREAEESADIERENNLISFFDVTYPGHCQKLEKEAKVILPKMQQIIPIHPHGVEITYRNNLDYNQEEIDLLTERHPLLSKKLIRLKVI